MNDTQLDRLDPDFFESDEEGYWQTPEEPGPDGKAKGIEFCLYVDDPWRQLTTTTLGDDFEFTEEEMRLYPAWIQERYPGCDWNFDADDQSTASFYDDFRDGEDNNDLMMRICVNNSEYNKVRNECIIFYYMMQDFIDYCAARRQTDG